MHARPACTSTPSPGNPLSAILQRPASSFGADLAGKWFNCIVALAMDGLHLRLVPDTVFIFYVSAG